MLVSGGKVRERQRQRAQQLRADAGACNAMQETGGLLHLFERFCATSLRGVCERGIAAAARCDLITIESLDKHPERPEIHLKFEPC